MNPLLSPTNSLFLPLSQLSPHCNRLLNSMNDVRISHKDRILIEQTLWNEVKKIRTLKETSVFLYLVGFYHAVFCQITKIPSCSDLFQYHILIRLGDLNRYMDRMEVAEYYYCNARNLFPQFGHAYNQLGLLTDPNDCFRCCYYYARAARSSERPLNSIADTNLRIAVTKYNCDLLNHILDNDVSIDLDESLSSEKLPRNAFEWFYVTIVSIYADNLRPIVKIFLRYLNENFSTSRSTTINVNLKQTSINCSRESYILLACLDIILDWFKLGSQGKVLYSTLSVEMRQIKTSLRNINNARLDDMHLTNMSSSSETSATNKPYPDNPSNCSIIQDITCSSIVDSSKSHHDSSKKQPALPHDYILRGYSPLDSVHSLLQFKAWYPNGESMESSFMKSTLNSENCFADEDLIRLIERIKSKMDYLGPLSKGRSRNIALESILSNMSQTNEF